MQFKVPQNIDMADRIVGPLTLIQFLYLLVGGIVVYALLNTVAPVNNLLFIALAVPIGLFSLALAFLKIQDQPFPKFVGAFFVFLTKPKMRIWTRVGIDPDLVITPDIQNKNITVEHKTINKSELERLAEALDTGGNLGPRASSPQPVRKIAPPNHLKRGRPVLDTMKQGKQPPTGAKHG